MTHAHDSTLLARLGFADPDRRNPLHDAACQYLAQESKTRKLVEMLLKNRMSPIVRKFENEDGSASDYVGTWSFDHRRAELEKHIFKGSGQYRSTIGFLDVELTITARRRDVGRIRNSSKITRYSGWAPATLDDLTGDFSARKFMSPIPAINCGHLRVTSVEGRDIYVKWAMEPMNDKAPPRSPIDIDQLQCWHDLPTKELREWVPYDSSIETSRDIIHIEVKAHPATAGDVLRQIALYREYAELGTWLLATCYPITRRDADALKNASIAHVQLDPATVQAWAEERDAGAYEAPSI
jgi:hypothetical protein